MRHRVGQRVTQALGRANRGDDDWAMYLGLAPGTMLAQSAVRYSIPADVRPDIDAALARLEGGWAQAEESAQQFWSTTDHKTIMSERQPDTPARKRPGRSRTAATAGSAVHEVTAVTRLWLGDPNSAAQAANQAALTLTNAGEIEHAAFWRYVQAQALYNDGTPGSTGRAIDALRDATQAGIATAWFVRLGRTLGELRGEQAIRLDDQPWLTWDEWINETGPSGIRRAVARCQTGLTGTHDEQAEALTLLGRIAGVIAERPTGNSVTDTVWNWPDTRRVEQRLWEVKTGEPDAIKREWVDQALGQVAAARPSRRLHVVGCVVTHLTTVKDDAAQAAREALALIHQDAVTALAQLLGDRLLDYAGRYGGGSAAERGAAREAVEHRLPRATWLTELFGPSNGRLIRREDVLRWFPS